MSSTLILTAPSVGRREARRPSLARRVFDALVAARMEAAEREVARHRPFISDTALVQGEYRTVGLSDSERLPFNR